MPKSRIIQASTEFFNEGIVICASTSFSTGCFDYAQHRFKAEKFEHAYRLRRLLGIGSRNFVNNAG